MQAQLKNSFPTPYISLLPLGFSILPLKKKHIQNIFSEVFPKIELEKLRKTRSEVFFKGKIGILRGRKDI
jgi:hypothetical protein